MNDLRSKSKFNPLTNRDDLAEVEAKAAEEGLHEKFLSQLIQLLWPDESDSPAVMDDAYPVHMTFEDLMDIRTAPSSIAARALAEVIQKETPHEK